MVGFSAGAMLTLTTALAGQEAKPAFIGDIYGPMGAVTVPADAPAARAANLLGALALAALLAEWVLRRRRGAR